jgi:hypothetical protein
MKKQEVAVMTEQQNANASHSGIDPGYLMVLVYVISVTALVLFGWFGAAGAHSSGDAGTAETAAVIRSLSGAVQP